MRSGRAFMGLALLGLTVGRPCFAEVTTVVEPPREDAANTAEDEGSTKAQETEAAEAPATGDRIVAVQEPDGSGRAMSPGEIDARIEALREERKEYGLGGPITMMAVGGGVALGAAYVYLLTQAACLGECETPTALVAVGAIGLGVGVWGGVLLGDRIGERRRNGREIKALEREKAQYEVSVLPAVGPDGGVVHVRLAF